MSTATLRGRLLGSLGLVGAAAALSLLVAYAPVAAAFTILLFTGAALLVRVVGARMTVWCLFVATLPLREPLSIDVVGTRTVYFNDVLLLALLPIVLHGFGLRRIWKESLSFRLGAVILLLTGLGIYTAARWTWALNFIIHTTLQLTAFYVAWNWIRTAREARWTLVAFVVGMVPVALYGFYQSRLPLDAFQGSIPALAWEADGTPRVRVFSTFEHPLHFSQLLSTAIAAALGLLLSVRALLGRFALVVAAGVLAYCNQLTYSMGGVIGTVVALGSSLALRGRAWLLALFPVLILGIVLFTPTALINRVDAVLQGEHSSLMARVVTYQQSLWAVRDHPILGLGWGSVGAAFEEEYLVTSDQAVAAIPENYFLVNAVAMGLIGLALVVVLCVRFFRNAAGRVGGWPRAALLAMGLAYYAQAQSQPTQSQPERYILWVMFALAERMRMAAAEAALPDGAEPQANGSASGAE